MMPGSLVWIERRDDVRVGLPDGGEEWLKAPFLTAVYLGPTTAPLCDAWSELPASVQKNSEILYGGRLLVVRPDAIKEMQS
jgi:hypothetical protein